MRPHHLDEDYKLQVAKLLGGAGAADQDGMRHWEGGGEPHGAGAKRQPSGNRFTSSAKYSLQQICKGNRRGSNQGGALREINKCDQWRILLKW